MTVGGEVIGRGASAIIVFQKGDRYDRQCNVECPSLRVSAGPAHRHRDSSPGGTGVC